MLCKECYKTNTMTGTMITIMLIGVCDKINKVCDLHLLTITR